MAVLKATSEVEFAVGSGRPFHSRMVQGEKSSYSNRYGSGGLDKQE